MRPLDRTTLAALAVLAFTESYTLAAADEIDLDLACEVLGLHGSAWPVARVGSFRKVERNQRDYRRDSGAGCCRYGMLDSLLLSWKTAQVTS